MSRIGFVLASVLAVVCVSTGQAEVVIDVVTVENPGNVADTRYEDCGWGGVNYVYNIGKFEITAGQYCEFLNAVAADDPFGLYSESMADPSTRYVWGCNIQRSGSPGGYSYTIAPDWADRPVNHVDWGDAARFCNWLHNGQPTGAQDLSTTEDGSYFLNGAMTDGELTAVVRGDDATWVIPTKDEWYKAAFHKNDGVTGNYWQQPTRSDMIPTSEAPPGTDMTNGSANHVGESYAIGSPYYRTEVGAYDAKPSDSPYGTFDQGGNVSEWNESAWPKYSERGCRGGSFGASIMWYTHAMADFYQDASREHGGIGFRVAEVPERKSDHDWDDDVDLDDFALFVAGFSDLRDYAIFQTAYTGAE